MRRINNQILGVKGSVQGGGGGVEVSLHVILQLREPFPIRKIPVVKDLPTNIKLCNYYLPQKITAECKTDPKNKEANE